MDLLGNTFSRLESALDVSGPLEGSFSASKVDVSKRLTKGKESASKVGSRRRKVHVGALGERIARPIVLDKVDDLVLALAMKDTIVIRFDRFLSLFLCPLGPVRGRGSGDEADETVVVAVFKVKRSIKRETDDIRVTDRLSRVTFLSPEGGTEKSNGLDGTSHSPCVLKHGSCQREGRLVFDRCIAIWRNGNHHFLALDRLSISFSCLKGDITSTAILLDFFDDRSKRDNVTF